MVAASFSGECFQLKGAFSGLRKRDMAISDPEAVAPTPRWEKVFGVIAIIVLVAFVILHVAGGGPGLHLEP